MHVLTCTSALLHKNQDRKLVPKPLSLPLLSLLSSSVLPVISNFAGAHTLHRTQPTVNPLSLPLPSPPGVKGKVVAGIAGLWRRTSLCSFTYERECARAGERVQERERESVCVRLCVCVSVSLSMRVYPHIG